MARESIVVREAVRRDADAISHLLREAFLEYEALYTPEAFAATAPSGSGVLARFEQGPIWVAERDQEIVGTVAALHEGDWILVRGMAVHPSARGLGVGSALLACIESLARAHAGTRLCLYTTAFLQEAIRLYEGAGFRFTGERASPHGTELLRMVKGPGGVSHS